MSFSITRINQSYPFPTSLSPPFPRSIVSPQLHLKYKIKTATVQCCTTASGADNGDRGTFNDWKRWVPKNFSFGPDKLFRSIAGATSSPICLFIPSPSTFLHAVDPRIKLVWLVVLVFLPARSHIFIRFGIVFSLAIISTWILPRDLWISSCRVLSQGNVILLEKEPTIVTCHWSFNYPRQYESSVRLYECLGHVLGLLRALQATTQSVTLDVSCVPKWDKCVKSFTPSQVVDHAFIDHSST